MSATGTPTPNLGLRIPLGTDPAAVEDINYNAGVLDTKIGALGNNTVKGLLDHASDEIGALGDGLAIIANGNTHAAIAAGEFVFVRNHSTLATGLYKATSSIAANATLSTSNLTADSKGGLNSLSDNIANISNPYMAQTNVDEASYTTVTIPTVSRGIFLIVYPGGITVVCCNTTGNVANVVTVGTANPATYSGNNVTVHSNTYYRSVSVIGLQNK